MNCGLKVASCLACEFTQPFLDLAFRQRDRRMWSDLEFAVLKQVGSCGRGKTFVDNERRLGS